MRGDAMDPGELALFDELNRVEGMTGIAMPPDMRADIARVYRQRRDELHYAVRHRRISAVGGVIGFGLGCYFTVIGGRWGVGLAVVNALTVAMHAFIVGVYSERIHVLLKPVDVSVVLRDDDDAPES